MSAISRWVRGGLELVDRVVPHDSLMDEAMTLAEEIAANPNDAAWAAKRLIQKDIEIAMFPQLSDRERGIFRPVPYPLLSRVEARFPMEGLVEV